MLKKILLSIVFLLIFLVAPTALADSGQLIQNGTFDRANANETLPDGWFADGWYTLSSDGVAEAALLDGEPVAHIVNHVDNDMRLCQTIAVEKNSYYKLSCDVLVSNITGGAGANVSVADSLASSDAVFSGEGWQHIELIGKTGADQTSLTVAVRIGGYGQLSKGEAWFDNFTVEKLVQAPAGTIADFSPAEASSGDSAEQSIEHLDALVLFVVVSVLFFTALYHRGVDAAIPLEQKQDENKRSKLYLLLAAGFVFRCALSLIFVGHSTDIGCFLAWSNKLAADGPGTFYVSGMFADYPPGYMVVLYLLGLVSNLLGLSYGSAGQILLIKMPAILTDLALAYFIYRLCAKRVNHGKALALAALIALNPLSAFISGGWGQIDSILAALLLLTVAVYQSDKKILAGAIFGLAIALKPQALMAGPLFAFMYLLDIRRESWKKNVLETVLAVVSAFCVILLLALPFWANQRWDWLLDKYFSTATSYPYGSIEAFNLMALLGGNWTPAAKVVFLFSYKTWGAIFIVLSILFSLFLYYKGRKKSPGCTLLVLAFLIAAIFTLGHYMHERYLFPALMLMLFAFVQYRDKRIMISFCWLSATLLINALAAFVIVDAESSRGAIYDALTAVMSFVTVAGFAYFTWAVTDIILRGRVFPAYRTKPEPEKQKVHGAAEQLGLEEFEEDGSRRLRFSRRDHLYCWALTIVYTALTLFNLGSLQAPQTYWLSQTIGEQVRIGFANETTISEMRVFGGIAEGAIDIEAGGYAAEFEQVNDDMYRWKTAAEDFTAKEVTLTVASGEVWLCEVAFFDADGNKVEAKLLSDVDASDAHNASMLLDEPDQVPSKATAQNGMYFDELYHGRTAYEHLHGLRPYENSHPPLGKIIIMTGIALFGMNAFGWRIMGALFGAAMVPLFYAFSKRLFKKPDYALLSSFLFTFDFMHFAQTRLATIDVYAVFFILLMFYFMYRYYTMSFLKHSLGATLKPLFFAGLFFALGAATKWIDIYAGGGLAVILFTSLAQRYREYRALGKERMPEYYKKLAATLACCAGFFIVIPIAVYLASYLPYVLSEKHYDLAGIWGVQKFMYNYHSTLEATHPFQSSWWQWPFTIRPIWYYWSGISETGLASSISSFGNPAVWWVSTIGLGVLTVKLLRRELRVNRGLFVILVGVCANFLPWVLVSRCTFIYHFFATVPFIIFGAVWLLWQFELRMPHLVWLRRVKWIWMALCLVLFIVFYPALSGMEVPAKYLAALEWMPTWVFETGA
ncbi:MAG: phospholipid carrier-dependent glycosyltransferase [Bacillota bacterium]